MPGRDGEVLTASRNAMRARIAKLVTPTNSHSAMDYVQRTGAGKLPIVELRQRRTRHSAVLHQDPFRAQAPGLLSVCMR